MSGGRPALREIPHFGASRAEHRRIGFRTLGHHDR